MSGALLDPKQRKGLYTAARKAPVSFALSMAAKPADSGLLLHKSANPKTLAAQVNAEVGSKKGIFGTLEIDGKTAIFVVTGPMASGAEKHLDKILKGDSAGLSVSVVTQAEHEAAGGDDDEDDPARMFTVPVLRQLIKLARSQGLTLPFAFAVGADASTHQLVLHKKMKPKQLFTKLTAAFDDVGKGTWGTASVDRKVLTLQFMKPLAGLKRMAIATLKDRGLPMKVVILDEKGKAVVEAGDEELDAEVLEDGPETGEAETSPAADAAPAPPAAAEPADPGAAATSGADAAAIAAILKKLAPRIAKAMKATPARAKEPVGLVAEVKAAMADPGSGDAAALLRQLRQVVDEMLGEEAAAAPPAAAAAPPAAEAPPPPPAPEPEPAAAAPAESAADAGVRAGLGKALSAVAPKVAAAVKDHPDQAGDLTLMLRSAKAAVDGGPLADARDQIQALMEFLKTLAARAAEPDASDGAPSAPSAPPADAPRGRVSFAKALLAYEQARNRARGQMDAFARAMAAQEPEEADLAGELQQELHALDEELSDAVIDELNSAESGSPEAIAAMRSAIGRLRTEISTNPLMQLIDDNEINPFARTTLVQTLLDGLSGLEKQVAGAEPA